MLSVGYFCKRTFYRNTVKWVHIYLYSCTVFAVHGLRFSAVSGHFCMVVIKSVLKLETQIYIKCHPNKSKEKLCYSYVYNAIHIHTKNSQCGIRYCPPIQNDDSLPCFLYWSFFYEVFYKIYKDITYKVKNNYYLAILLISFIPESWLKISKWWDHPRVFFAARNLQTSVARCCL